APSHHRAIRSRGRRRCALFRLFPPFFSNMQISSHFAARVAALPRLPAVPCDARGGGALCLALSPDGALIGTGSRDGVVCVYRRNGSGGAFSRVFAGRLHDGAVTSIDFSGYLENGAASNWLMATGGSDGAVR